MHDIIEALHSAYCSSTGLDIRLAYDRERAWVEFHKAGFTASDVHLVGCWLRRAVEKGERNPGCLRFRNLIEPVHLFEEELQLVKAAMRNFKAPATEKEKVIKAFRPEVGEPPATVTARPSKDVLRTAIDQVRRAIG